MLYYVLLTDSSFSLLCPLQVNKEIHNKRRYNLSAERTEDLIFCSVNIRTIAKMEAPADGPFPFSTGPSIPSSDPCEDEDRPLPEGVGKYLELTHSQRVQEKDDVDAAIRASLRTAGEHSSGFVGSNSEAEDESPDPCKPPALDREDAAVDFDAVIASNERIPPIPGGECSLYESDEQAARAMVAMQMAQAGAAAAADINEAVDDGTEKED